MTKRASATGRFLCAMVIAASLAGCAMPQPGATRTPAEADAIGQVSRVRRLLRTACSRLKAANEGAANRAAQMAEAGSDTADALEQWNGFIKGSAGRAPRVYANHPQWVAATAEISDGIAEMLRQVEKDNPGMAFKACGATCGKFVVLNEQAGVRRTSDVLFHFRKAATPLALPAAKGDVAAVAPVVDTLLKLRDRSLTDPVGGVGTPAQRDGALRAFSAAVDAFAAAVNGNESGGLAELYGGMMACMESAYDLYL